MKFGELSIKNVYDSVRDDLYGEFFSPILSNSVECMRVGGNFTSKNFLKIAEGMQEFIIKDGIMKLVLLPNFSKDDIIAINTGLKNDRDVLLENWIKEQKGPQAKIEEAINTSAEVLKRIPEFPKFMDKANYALDHLLPLDQTIHLYYNQFLQRQEFSQEREENQLLLYDH